MGERKNSTIWEGHLRVHYQYILENASMLTTPFGAVKFPWIKKNYGGSSNENLREATFNILLF